MRLLFCVLCFLALAEAALLTENVVEDEDQPLEKWPTPKPKPQPDSCWKEIKERGEGTAPKADGTCPTGTEESAGKCYSPCGKSFKGLGPLCWPVCVAPYGYNGIVFCCKSEEICNEHLKELGSVLPNAVAKIVVDSIQNAPREEILKDLQTLLKELKKFEFPECAKIAENHPDLILIDEVA